MRPGFFLLILLAFLSAATSFGQKSNKKITISGYVQDASQKPVSKAIILIDNAKTSCYTDSEGNYKIKVNPHALKIGIFVLPNIIAEQTIGGRTQINFLLESLVNSPQVNPATSGGEEVVNIGYGSTRKKNVNGPVNKIDASKSRNASYNTIYEMIRAEVPGVTVDGKTILIRGGSTSINAGNEPLLIVDGAPVSSIDDIHPLMVKSIEVLKGSSAAIYGSRGSNGVILITLRNSTDK
jgi:TonB-dependent SusC/RagA subfamily outer membrane receptor